MLIRQKFGVRHGRLITVIVKSTQLFNERSEKIKGEYIKLCRKIKLAYGILNREENHKMKVVNMSKNLQQGQNGGS
jgi:hypothetical protein